MLRTEIERLNGAFVVAVVFVVVGVVVVVFFLGHFYHCHCIGSTHLFYSNFPVRSQIFEEFFLR